MADEFTYHFVWDPAKAAENLAKHGVSFRLSTTIFRDALALTVYDDEHSQAEERWATIGREVEAALPGAVLAREGMVLTP